MTVRPARENQTRQAPGAPRRLRPEGRTGKRLLLALALLLCGFALAGCAALTGDAPAMQAAGPNLALLALPAYDDPEAQGDDGAVSGAEYMPVDLWLDGTQNMGGINPNAESMYPHTGKKYREGGFHYHYGTQTGWYENLLNLFLTAAGETRVRVLRYGNETMPETVLAQNSLLLSDALANSSVWRDMHTVSLAANAGLFQQMASEDMSQSFYALGSPAWVNRLDALNAQALENPDLAANMDAALNLQIAGIAAGESGFTLEAGSDGQQCALLTALNHLDTDRLSVITVDPASVRKVTGSDETGKPLAYYEQLLRDKGVFDLGLCVGVLDFNLDYLGQIGSLSTATFSEPLIWGRLILDEKKQTFEAVGVMPRRLITLVIGTRARVNGFIDRLAEGIAGDRTLQGLRGPQNGEFAYAAAGQTVTQQPFTFEWNHTVIARPGMGTYTQHTEGATLIADGETAAQGDAAQPATGTALTGATAQTATEPSAASEPSAAAAQTVAAAPTAIAAPTPAPDTATAQVLSAANGLPLLRLTPDAAGGYPDRTLTVRLPIAASGDGATLDVSRLSGAGIQPLSSLLLSAVLPNTPENAKAGGANAIAYRDKRYVFEKGADASAFSLQSIALRDGALVCTLAVDGDRLLPGYYRLRLTADATGEQVAWETVPWIDGDQSVSATFTDAELYAWQTFTEAMTEYDRDAKGLPRMFQLAWGGYTDKLYHGLRVPDFPPVYRSIRLKELVSQIRDTAASDVSPLIRYAFEVFVDGL